MNLFVGQLQMKYLLIQRQWHCLIVVGIAVGIDVKNIVGAAGAVANIVAEAVANIVAEAVANIVAEAEVVTVDMVMVMVVMAMVATE